jgi:hypothetical protein
MPVPMPSAVYPLLRSTAIAALQGETPSGESIDALNKVASTAMPGLLQQQSWRCTHCERPAITFQVTMGLAYHQPDFTPSVSNAVPCLPSCDGDACFERCYADHQRMLRDIRHGRRRPASVLGDAVSYPRGGSEVMSCSKCEQTSFRTEIKFKACSRCKRARYWCAASASLPVAPSRGLPSLSSG